MGRWYRIMAAAAAALALGCAAPEGALASDTQETIVQDDTSLIYASPTKVAHALVALKTLGVDRIRVSVVWSLVAPHAKSSRRPKFDATNPNAYPRGVWNRYDTVVRLAYSYGIKVYFQLTAPPRTGRPRRCRFRRATAGRTSRTLRTSASSSRPSAGAMTGSSTTGASGTSRTSAAG